ncbi:MAG: glycosyltransferase family 9 protein, partial [Nitrospiraceae bacterium]
ATAANDSLGQRLVPQRADAGAVMQLMRRAPVDLTGQTQLGHLPALLQAASLLITNDSGPMHVAAAVGTPVVALFGPTNPVRTGPYGAGHRVLASRVPCSPCYSRQCRHPVPLECLTNVSPAQVLEAVREQLAVRSAR